MAAEREDAGRFIVHADEMLTAFLELQAAIHCRFELGQPAKVSAGLCCMGDSPRYETGRSLKKLSMHIYEVRPRRDQFELIFGAT